MIRTNQKTIVEPANVFVRRKRGRPPKNVQETRDLQAQEEEQNDVNGKRKKDNYLSIRLKARSELIQPKPNSLNLSKHRSEVLRTSKKFNLSPSCQRKKDIYEETNCSPESRSPVAAVHPLDLAFRENLKAVVISTWKEKLHDKKVSSSLSSSVRDVAHSQKVEVSPELSSSLHGSVSEASGGSSDFGQNYVGPKRRGRTRRCTTTTTTTTTSSSSSSSSNSSSRSRSSSSSNSSRGNLNSEEDSAYDGKIISATGICDTGTKDRVSNSHDYSADAIRAKRLQNLALYRMQSKEKAKLKIARMRERPPEMISFRSVEDIPQGLPCAFVGYEDRLVWYCEECASVHALTSSVACAPFSRKHGLRMVDVEADGDCFYSCIVQCMMTLPPNQLSKKERSDLQVSTLRDWVAAKITNTQLDFYKMLALASPKDPFLNFIRPAASEEAPNQPIVKTLEALKLYVKQEGQVCGHSNCLWADNFAHMVVADKLRLTLLLIDMERGKGCLPYRYLHLFNAKDRPFPDSRVSPRSSSASMERQPERFIVLKRQGPVGHFQYLQRVSDDRACFTNEELPEVIRTLWNITYS